MQFEFGQRVVDAISGIEGYVVGRTEYFTGCVHFGVAPAGGDEKGKPKEWEWWDAARLRASVNPGLSLRFEASTLPAGPIEPRTFRGGPMPNPPEA